MMNEMFHWIALQTELELLYLYTKDVSRTVIACWLAVCTDHVGERTKGHCSQLVTHPPTLSSFTTSLSFLTLRSVDLGFLFTMSSKQREPSDVSVEALDLVNHAMTLDTHSPTFPLRYDSFGLCSILSSLPHIILHFVIQFADPFLYQTLLDLSLFQCYIFLDPVLTDPHETNTNVSTTDPDSDIYHSSSFDLAGLNKKSVLRSRIHTWPK